MSFRPYRDADAAGVAALLEDSAPPIYRWKLHALHGPGRDEPSRWRSQGSRRPGRRDPRRGPRRRTTTSTEVGRRPGRWPVRRFRSGHAGPEIFGVLAGPKSVCLAMSAASRNPCATAEGRWASLPNVTASPPSSCHQVRTVECSGMRVLISRALPVSAVPAARNGTHLRRRRVERTGLSPARNGPGSRCGPARRTRRLS